MSAVANVCVSYRRKVIFFMISFFNHFILINFCQLNFLRIYMKTRHLSDITMTILLNSYFKNFITKITFNKENDQNRFFILKILFFYFLKFETLSRNLTH